jgi:hypothetical protein
MLDLLGLKLHQDEFNMLKASQKVEWQRFQNATRNLSQDQKSRMEIEKRYTMQKELIAAEKDMIQKKLQNAQDVLQKAKELNNVEGVQKAEIMIEQLEIQKEKVEHEDDYVESVYEGTKGINEQRIALEEFNKEMEKKQKEFSHAQEVRGLEHAISEQGMIQQGKSPTAIAQAEFDHKKEMIDLERQHTTERMKNLAADINKNNYQGDILEKKMEELEALGMENELLGKRKQLLEAEEMTFQMQDQLQMAEDFATNITDSITAIGDAMRGNIEDMAAAFDQMGKKFMEDALKPSLKQIQDSMRELFMKMGKWTGTAVMAGIGIAFTAISSFLKKQKAEVESLADEAEEGIVEGERVRGVVAGDNQIAVAKIRDNMKDALRQTNGILTSIDAAVWKTAGGSSIAGGEEVPTQSENNQTQGGFARESIAGARV